MLDYIFRTEDTLLKIVIEFQRNILLSVVEWIFIVYNPGIPFWYIMQINFYRRNHEI